MFLKVIISLTCKKWQRNWSWLDDETRLGWTLCGGVGGSSRSGTLNSSIAPLTPLRPAGLQEKVLVWKEWYNMDEQKVQIGRKWSRWKRKGGKIGSEEYVGREMVQKLGRWPRLVLVNRSTWCIPASSNPNFHLLRANKQPWNTFSASSHLYFSLSLNIFVLGGPSINTLSHSFHCSLTLSSSLAMSLFPSDYSSMNMLI